MKTKTHTLVRESLLKPQPTNEASQEMKDFAKKVRNVLGYKLIRACVSTPTTLRQVLIDLEIEPFSKVTVEAYKRKMKAAAEKTLDEDDERDVNWRVRPLAYYVAPVPEFVLNKAMQVKEAFPEVRLEVEQLGIAKPDPFLVASFGNEKYYIEVWDEPHFEDKFLKKMYASKSKAGEFDDDEEDASDE